MAVKVSVFLLPFLPVADRDGLGRARVDIAGRALGAAGAGHADRQQHTGALVGDLDLVRALGTS